MLILLPDKSAKEQLDGSNCMQRAVLTALIQAVTAARLVTSSMNAANKPAKSQVSSRTSHEAQAS
jgi:hypothetical protein